MNNPWTPAECLKLLAYYHKWQADHSYSIYQLIRDFQNRYSYFNRTLESIRSKLWRMRVRINLEEFEDDEIDVELPEFIELADSTEDHKKWLMSKQMWLENENEWNEYSRKG